MCPGSDQLNTMLKHDNESSYKGMIAVQNLNINGQPRSSCSSGKPQSFVFKGSGYMSRETEPEIQIEGNSESRQYLETTTENSQSHERKFHESQDASLERDQSHDLPEQISVENIQNPRPESIQEIKQKFSEIMGKFKLQKEDMVDDETAKKNKMEGLKSQIKKEIK